MSKQVIFGSLNPNQKEDCLYPECENEAVQAAVLVFTDMKGFAEIRCCEEPRCMAHAAELAYAWSGEAPLSDESRLRMMLAIAKHEGPSGGWYEGSWFDQAIDAVLEGHEIEPPPEGWFGIMATAVNMLSEKGYAVGESGIKWDPEKQAKGEMPFWAWIEPHATGEGWDIGQAATACMFAAFAKIKSEEEKDDEPEGGH